MLSTIISGEHSGSSISWECNPLPCEGQCRRHFQQMACFENPPKQTALVRCRTCNPDHVCQPQLPASPRSIPWCARALDGVAGPTPRFSFLGGRSPLAEPQSHRVWHPKKTTSMALHPTLPNHQPSGGWNPDKLIPTSMGAVALRTCG